jgi:hypothetical protein
MGPYHAVIVLKLTGVDWLAAGCRHAPVDIVGAVAISLEPAPQGN